MEEIIIIGEIDAATLEAFNESAWRVSAYHEFKETRPYGPIHADNYIQEAKLLNAYPLYEVWSIYLESDLFESYRLVAFLGDNVACSFFNDALQENEVFDYALDAQTGNIIVYFPFKKGLKWSWETK